MTAELEPVRLALIACGKAKLDHAAPARELYTGSLFRAARRHAESGRYASYRILSAQHRLLDPDRVIEPYDRTIGDLDDQERWLWGEVVSGVAICCWLPLRSRQPIEIDVFAGQAYVDALPTRWRRGNRDEPTVTLRYPHAGLTMFERLRAFSQAATAATTNP